MCDQWLIIESDRHAENLNRRKVNAEKRRFALLPSAFLLISLMGLFLLMVLTFYSSTPTRPLQKQSVGLVFMTICAMGTIAGVVPSKCSKLFHYTRRESKRIDIARGKKDNAATIKIEGHHPDCGKFSAHVIRFGGRIYCAGCSGLVTGAILAIAGSFLYFFAGLNVADAGMPIFWFGLVGVCLGLLQYSRPFAENATVHFSLNVIFVVGTFLLLVGVDGVNGGFVLESYLLVLVSYWIVTRITLSQWEHKKICVDCGSEKCSSFGIQET